MNDLYRLIVNLDSALRDGLALVWQVELDSTDPIQQAQCIGDAMLSIERLTLLSSDLSEQAQTLLTRISQQGGALPLHRLQAYGDIRKLGSARLMREQPWLFPVNPLEELVYKGFCFQIYVNTGQLVEEQLVIADQLLPHIRILFPFALSNSITGPIPSRVSTCGNSFEEDMMAILVNVRKHMPHASSRVSIASAIDTEIERLSGRLLGEQESSRLSLLRQIVLGMGLVKAEHGRLLPASKARTWLRFDDVQRAAALLGAWQQIGSWRELELVQTIECDRNALKHDPRPGREIILQYLAGLPESEWISTDQFIARIKLEHPDLLRPDGDMQSWHIHDARTGELLAGFEHWERIEGATIRAMLSKPLCWLGFVALGDDGKTFKLTPIGAASLLGKKECAIPQKAGVAILDASFRVHMPTAQTLYDRYQLERFAQWEAQTDDEAVLRITAESIWEGQNANVPVDRVQRFLERITGGQVPDIVRQTLRAWGGRFGRVLVRRVILLETDDRETMQNLQDWPDVSPLLEHVISPTVCLVREENLQELTACLKAHGIWPHVRIDPS